MQERCVHRSTRLVEAGEMLRPLLPTTQPDRRRCPGTGGRLSWRSCFSCCLCWRRSPQSHRAYRSCAGVARPGRVGLDTRDPRHGHAGRPPAAMARLPADHSVVQHLQGLGKIPVQAMMTPTDVVVVGLAPGVENTLHRPASVTTWRTPDDARHRYPVIAAGHQDPVDTTSGA